jgi:hypothetical protein
VYEGTTGAGSVGVEEWTDIRIRYYGRFAKLELEWMLIEGVL